MEPEQLANTLSMMESSGGQDTRNKNEGSEAWYYGFTADARKELERVGKLPEGYDKNNREKIKEAVLAYFDLLRNRFPDATDEELYLAYWKGPTWFAPVYRGERELSKDQLKRMKDFTNFSNR